MLCENYKLIPIYCPFGMLYVHSMKLKFGIGKRASSTKDKSLFASSLLIHEYKMDYARRGKCLIFCQTKMPEYLQLEDRVGTEIDCQNLRRVFANLGFDVEIHEELTVKKIDKVLEKGKVSSLCSVNYQLVMEY